MSTTPALCVEDLRAAALARHSFPSAKVGRALAILTDTSQEKIAAVLGVHRETISRYQSGERHPQGEIRDRYLQVLETLWATVLDLMNAGLVPVNERQKAALGDLLSWLDGTG